MDNTFPATRLSMESRVQFALFAVHCWLKRAHAQPDITMIPWSFSWADAQLVSHLSWCLGLFSIELEVSVGLMLKFIEISLD